MAVISDRPSIIVLSRNYSTGLGLIRSLGAAGYTVDLLASARRKNSSSIASSSKYVRRSVEFLKPDIYDDRGEEIVEYHLKIAQDEEGRRVLFPADDYTTSVIDLNRERLSAHYLMPGTGDGTDGQLLKLMQKNIQGQYALDAGLTRARETVVSLEDMKIPGDLPYPCFVKPLKSIDGEKQEMAKCENEKELNAVLKAMGESFAHRSVLVQEYLDIDKEYDVGGVCLGDRAIIPAVIEKTRIAEHERGVTMTGKMVEREVLGDVFPKLVSMLRSLDYYGMFDLEFISARGKLYFNEINLRSGGPHYSYFLNGVNLPDIFVRGICGIEPEPKDVTLESYGKSFVYEKVAWEDHINGFMTKAELDDTIGKADFTLLAQADDPAPGKIFSKKIRLSMLKQRTLKLLKGKR